MVKVSDNIIQAPPVKRGWVRVLVLTLLSFGLYTFYWFYVTRRDVFREQGNTSSSALLHTLGLFVPILQFVVFYWLAKDIDQLAENIGANRQSVPLAVVLWIFVGPAGLVVTQVAWNDYWDKKSNGKAVEAPLKFVEFVPVIVAAVCWFLFFVLMAGLILFAVDSQKPLRDAEDHLQKAAELVANNQQSKQPLSPTALSQVKGEIAAARSDLSRYQQKKLSDDEIRKADERELAALDQYVQVYQTVFADGRITTEAELVQFKAALDELDRADRVRQDIDARRQSNR